MLVLRRAGRLGVVSGVGVMLGVHPDHTHHTCASPPPTHALTPPPPPALPRRTDTPLVSPPPQHPTPPLTFHHARHHPPNPLTHSFCTSSPAHTSLFPSSHKHHTTPRQSLHFILRTPHYSIPNNTIPHQITNARAHAPTLSPTHPSVMVYVQGFQGLFVNHSKNTSKTPEGRSATFRVQGLCFFLIFSLGCYKSEFLASIAARFLVKFLLKKSFFEPNC